MTRQVFASYLASRKDDELIADILKQFVAD
jgi:hypothetical protein